MLNTSVQPGGRFRVGVHQPAYRAVNLRQGNHLDVLGRAADGSEVVNAVNFPQGDIEIEKAKTVYEILNPFPFRGCTYIDSAWADGRAAHPEEIRLEQAPPVSLRDLLDGYCPPDAVRKIVQQLPLPLQYELAGHSTDPEELIWLAEASCCFVHDADGQPAGLRYAGEEGRMRPVIYSVDLFETVANNPHLPDLYKEIMLLRPGVQGNSPIVGDIREQDTCIFEYLRANSYIPGGHYAANFAPGSIRYRIEDLSERDMRGLRHLYYQRAYCALAQKLGIALPIRRRPFTSAELEQLRLDILAHLPSGEGTRGWATLWGWNFGYDFSGSGYRLHASHQMIHQQYALVPPWMDAEGERAPSYACGDLVADTVAAYHQAYQSDFFRDYLAAIRNNTRTDGQAGESSLIVWEDEHVLLFVPKAQVSQWELHIMVHAENGQGDIGPVGNILEADAAARRSLDTAILTAQRVLAAMGARMVTSIEYAKRIGLDNGQRLLYAMLPKLPWAMGGFTEAQGRFICGHYPEDFARACRRHLP